MVPFLARPGLRPASRFGRLRAKDATTAITRRLTTKRIAHARTGLFWGLALLGLLLLPSDYRAGAESAHGHALIHLWLDAADGAVHHHHDPVPGDVAWNWLDPAIGNGELGRSPASFAQPDVGQHHDSAPVGGTVQLLVKSVTLLLLPVARIAPAPAPRRALTGRAVPVLFPPPRWTSVAD